MGKGGGTDVVLGRDHHRCFGPDSTNVVAGVLARQVATDEAEAAMSEAEAVYEAFRGAVQNQMPLPEFEDLVQELLQLALDGDTTATTFFFAACMDGVMPTEKGDNELITLREFCDKHPGETTARLRTYINEYGMHAEQEKTGRRRWLIDEEEVLTWIASWRAISGRYMLRDQNGRTAVWSVPGTKLCTQCEHHRVLEAFAPGAAWCKDCTRARVLTHYRTQAEAL